MSINEKLKEDWLQIQEVISNKFGGGETMNVDAIVYLIGVQELGKGHQIFNKDEKLALIHIAVCRLLEPYGYYEFEFYDNDGWPHYQLKEELPFLKSGEQTILLKEAIVRYFKEKELV